MSRRHPHPDDLEQPPRERPRQFVTLTGRVRSIDLSPPGRLTCVLDTSAGRLKAMSDAASVHGSKLVPGRQVQVVLLRLKRSNDKAASPWQLLGCRGLEEEPTCEQSADREGRSQ